MDPTEENPTGESEPSADKRATIVPPPEVLSGERQPSVDVAVDPVTTIVPPPPEVSGEGRLSVTTDPAKRGTIVAPTEVSGKGRTSVSTEVSGEGRPSVVPEVSGEGRPSVVPEVSGEGRPSVAPEASGQGRPSVAADPAKRNTIVEPEVSGQGRPSLTADPAKRTTIVEPEVSGEGRPSVALEISEDGKPSLVSKRPTLTEPELLGEDEAFEFMGEGMGEFPPGAIYPTSTAGSTEVGGEGQIPQTAGTSPFDVSTTDAEGETKHFNSEETTESPTEGGTVPPTVTIDNYGEEEFSGEAGDPPQSGLSEFIAPPTVVTTEPEAELSTVLSDAEEEVDSSAYDAGISDFVMPPEQKYHPEDEDLGGESEEEEDFPYTPYTFPPEEQMATDELVVKFLRRSDEYPGEVDDFNLGDDQNPDRELSTLSVKSLDEMIRMLQGLEKEDGTGNTELLANVNPSTLQDTSGEMATSAVDLEHKHHGHTEDHLVVLGPNHPKMQRFQEALRQHLERQMYQATIETRDAEHELKMLRREREETGQHLYNLQFELARQSDHMGKLDSQLDHLHKQRAEHDAEGEILERELCVVKDNLMKEIEIEEKMIQAIKEMDMMEWCIRQTDQEYEGEAKIQGQLDEQFKRVKTKTELEKRNQDFYLDKVMTHVQRMEQMNAGIQRQIQAHLDEQRDLNSSINEAGTEIEVIQIEKHHLSTAWNETISVVRARDEALRAARETLQASKEELRNRESELKSITRGIKKEQEKHEEKWMLLKRRRMEERIAESQLKALQEHSAELQSQLSILHQIKHQVEQDYLKAANLLSRKERDIQQPRRQLELYSAEKARLEDLILFHMQEHDAVDKVTIGLAKKIQQAREKTRTIDAEVAKVENDMTNLTITVERLKTDLLKKTTGLDEMEKKLKSQEKILQAQAADMKQSEKLIQKKTSEIEHMTRKLKKIIDDHGGVEVGPLEKEVDEVEKQIAGHRSICVDLQEQWLKLQDELVTLTGQRDAILAENELIRKEGFIMERKKQRLEQEVATKRIGAEKIKKQIEILQKEIQVYNAKLYHGKEEETQMDRDNILIQNEFISLLKDAETEAVDLQQEITNLEEEKDALTAALTEGHEKCLWWEKKVKLARELRDSIKQEQESSTSALKLAIHHMQVRYQELLRVQEKLMGDLDRSIDRRDRIITQADHDLRRANVNPNRTKLNIQRNRESIEEKNKQVVREALEAEREVKEMQAKISALEGKLKCELDALRKIREMIANADERISDATVEKHKDMIELFLRQQKYKVLEAISNNRYRSMHTSEDIDSLCKEGEELCYELAELCEILLNQYPDMSLSIKLIKACIFTTAH